MADAREFTGKSGAGSPHNGKDFLLLRAESLGQCCPHPCPEHCPQGEAFGELGEPLSIAAVAELIGVSPWTIRYRYLKSGIPHFRTGRQGKLIFYRNQVIHWLLSEQQKGGTNP